MLALVCALGEEMSGLKKPLALEKANSRNGALFRGSLSGSKILVARTGMGRAKAESAADYILKTCPVSALISFGFCGALVDGMAPGDMVVGSAQCSEGHEITCDTFLLSLAREVMPEIRTGKGITVEKLMVSPEGKIALGRASGAAFVDMEGYWLARLAAQRGLPFLAVRSVFDTVAKDLAPFDHISGRGALSAYAASHPWQAGRLLGLRWDMLRARDSLTRFLTAFIKAYTRESARTGAV